MADTQKRQLSVSVEMFDQPGSVVVVVDEVGVARHLDGMRLRVYASSPQLLLHGGTWRLCPGHASLLVSIRLA